MWENSEVNTDIQTYKARCVKNFNIGFMAFGAKLCYPAGPKFTVTISGTVIGVQLTAVRWAG